jgi:hypothetical protein
MSVALLSAAAFLIAGYMLGVSAGRRNVARVYDLRPHCSRCVRKAGRPMLLWRCDCGEEMVGPAVADDIRDDCFFDYVERP